MENTIAAKATKPKTIVDKTGIVRVNRSDITNAHRLLDEAYFVSTKANQASCRLKLIL